MNKLIFTALILMLTIGAQAQSRKYVSNFSAYQHVHNPSLTGNEGSMLKTYYRNQWTGFEDAPKTLFFSGELDAADLKKSGNRTSHYQYRNSGKNYQGAQHAFALVALQERFGPIRETQIGLNYGTGVRLTETLSFRFGTALTYNNFRLDGSSLVVDNTSDPRYQHVMGQYNSLSKLDMNLGFALAAGNYYLGYALQDITKGHFITTGDSYMKEAYTRKHVVQAGYRTYVTDAVAVITNGLYQYDEDLKGTLEGQVKLLYNDVLWAGGGYRNDQAFHLAAGLNYKRLRFSYAYESPVAEARSVNQPTNEIGVAYTLKPVQIERIRDKSVSVW